MPLPPATLRSPYNAAWPARYKYAFRHRQWLEPMCRRASQWRHDAAGNCPSSRLHICPAHENAQVCSATIRHARHCFRLAIWMLNRAHLRGNASYVTQPAPRSGRQGIAAPSGLMTCWSHMQNRTANRYSNTMMVASTARLSPGSARSSATVQSRSARKIFSIFMASTTHSASPAFTCWPSVT